MIDEILSKNEVQQKAFTASIQQITDQKQKKVKENITSLIASVKNNPHQSLDAKKIATAFGGDALTRVVTEVVSQRPLTDEELSLGLLSELMREECRQTTNTTRTFEAGEVLFKSLTTHEQKCKLALYSSIAGSFHDFVPSAKAFLEEELSHHNDAWCNNATEFKVARGHFSKESCIAFTLSMTKDDFDGVDVVADKIIKLVSMGYPSGLIEVMERHLSANGSIYLNIERAADEGKFSIMNCNFTSFKSRESDPKKNLVAALKYLAVHEWYRE